jgi:hypothetical protein
LDICSAITAPAKKPVEHHHHQAADADGIHLENDVVAVMRLAADDIADRSPGKQKELLRVRDSRRL